jgi:hypothetical protein
VDTLFLAATGHNGAKDGAGYSGAEPLPRKEESITALAHVGRGVSERKWSEHMGCVKERCRGKRYCLLWDRQRMEPAAFHAQKTIASRFYQLRMNKAPIGPYLPG